MNARDNTPTSPTLLERLRESGDSAAWSRFDASYGDLIVAFARRRGIQATDAEDVRQMVMLKLMSSLKQFEYQRERGRFRDYLLRVTQSTISDWASKAGRNGQPSSLGLRHLDTKAEACDSITRAPGGSSDVETDAVQHAWHEEWEAFHFRRAWHAVQSQFSTQHLDVFIRLLAGDPVRLVAQHMGLTEEAVHKVKQRVRDCLKNQVATQVAEEDGG